ncbi:hypothetical protein MKW98_031968 [Papaver atlanticum]|uniref:Btz domain-containing protein n=1 Tax=Papaver atlanticum TaxID=357466 RepID=A0AAD4XD10_9MAGN|nr:hypothetical protein MKW98_031968 [Papaver atlanticum]
MSGREGRESDTKRSSHLERESSSKRSRRDGKPATERNIPRSGSFFEHDEHGSAAQGGRSFGRRDSTDYGHVSNPNDRSVTGMEETGGPCTIQHKEVTGPKVGEMIKFGVTTDT